MKKNQKEQELRRERENQELLRGRRGYTWGRVAGAFTREPRSIGGMQ